jgi:hypothetical protein
MRALLGVALARSARASAANHPKGRLGAANSKVTDERGKMLKLIKFEI